MAALKSRSFNLTVRLWNITVVASSSVVLLVLIGQPAVGFVVGAVGMLIEMAIGYLARYEPQRWEDEPPLAGDRSPLVPRPPLLVASASQRWPEE